MKTKLLIILPFLAVLLTGCGAFGDTKSEPLTATNAAVPNVTGTNAVVPNVTGTNAAVATVTNARIDAASFLNALVDSGCEIDEAEYKEVKRGGGIKVTCTKSKDLLGTEGLDAL